MIHQKFSRLPILMTLNLFLWAQPGLTSGWSSAGGGGFSHMSDNVWFVGDAQLSYCLKVDPAFPLKQNQLGPMVQAAFAEWAQFFKRNQLAGKPFQRQLGNQLWTLPNKNKQSINFNFSEKPCTDSTDLQIYFGGTNEAIDLHKNLNDEHKLGLAIRKDYNHVTLKNPGIVWVSAFTTSEIRIKHLLLHELGHVFGLAHDTLPVMDSEVASQLIEPRVPDAFFGQIEHSSWTYRLKAGAPVLLTQNFGFAFEQLLKSPANAAKIPACPQDHFPNLLIPVKILRQFQLPLDSCHRVEIVMKNPDFSQRKFTLELKLKDSKTAKSVSVVGLFTHTKISNVEHPSPHIYTKAVNSQSGKEHWLQLRLDQEADFFPARGSFDFQGRSFAARISYEKGPIFEIFFDNRQEGTWWVIRNFSALLDRVE